MQVAVKDITGKQIKSIDLPEAIWAGGDPDAQAGHDEFLSR